MSATQTRDDQDSLLTQGRESGRQVVALGAAALLSVVAFDLVLGGRLSLFFDLSFIVLCLALALLVRPEDLFVVGVLPPLIMVGAFALLGATAPETIARAGDSPIQAVVSGLALHSGALVAGYSLCLGALALRSSRS